MKTLVMLLLSSFILATSCSKEELVDTQTDADGVIISLPYQWQKSLHNNGVVSNSSVRKAIYYNGNIAIPTTNGGNNRLLTLINPNNGDFIWSWDDRYQPETEDVFITYYHQYNNLLTYQRGKRSYCINLDEGSTHWKFQRDSPYDVRVFPNSNNTFFYLVDIIDDAGYKEQTATLCDINTGELSKVIRANYSGDYISPTNSIGSVIDITKLNDMDYLYAITYSEPLPEWKKNSFLGLYNSDTEEWVYERKLLAPPTVNSSVFWTQIYNNKIYANVGKKLVCHDLATGEQIWSRQFPQDFLFSGFIIEEDKIIANNEDTFTYGLDPENGAILWKTATSGTSGRISYLNGIAYFVGGSSDRLHAIDVNTGEHVWKLDADKMESNSSGFKTNAIYVFPAAGSKPAKVIALSHLHAFCFDAYQ